MMQTSQIPRRKPFTSAYLHHSELKKHPLVCLSAYSDFTNTRPSASDEYVNVNMSQALSDQSESFSSTKNDTVVGGESESFLVIGSWDVIRWAFDSNSKGLRGRYA